jgi:ubiquinone/menaquinone biosynthesis C-methylase UbiE
MSFRDIISEQFGNPQGALGAMAGVIMAYRGSNRKRTEWAISLLDISPDESVLEIGFGPGIGIQELCRIASMGTVTGIDRSSLMVRTATRRNRDAISSGRARLVEASVEHLPSLDARYDKILDVNTFQFWNDQVATLSALRSLMNPEGIIAIAHQPRHSGAKREDTLAMGKLIADAMVSSGIAIVKTEILETRPVPTICMLGRNAQPRLQ